MKINIPDFMIRPEAKAGLRKRPTRTAPFYASEKEYKRSLKDGLKELRSLQELLYATGEQSLLLIFQAMDGAGKDSAIKNVMSGVNPQGCQVFSFKKPSEEELRHDFLWRTAVRLPELGKIGIFNRSYYEEVLVVKVHPELLAVRKFPSVRKADESFWRDRYRSIRESEGHLHRNGTRIVKFFLHLSAEEQKERLLARIDDPEKNWKAEIGDVAERARWDDYMEAYEDCIAATSTAEAPWYVIPADDKKNAQLIISRIIRDTLGGLAMSFPTLDKAKHKELRKMRESLEK